MIIIPVQGGTYRHLRGRVTRLLAESGQSPCASLARHRATSERELAPAPNPLSARGPFHALRGSVTHAKHREKRTVEVGTGFVMFPHADADPPGGSQFYDPLNHSAFSVSRQCDILVYDVAKYPAIFRDRDFVVIRPEAVRAVIEVKGSLSRREVLSAVSSFHDFAVKWRTTQLFYREQHVPLTPNPPLIVMAWSISTDAAGRLRVTPAAACKMIARFYAENVNLDEVDGYPFLQQLFIHNEAQIIGSLQVEQTSQGFVDHYGWSAWDGCFIRASKDGSLRREKDRTIAQLLAALHIVVAEEDFNRFFSYQNEVKNQSIIPYKYATSSRAWSNLDVATVKRIIAKTVNSDAAS
jgi:hypothetical protein